MQYSRADAVRMPYDHPKGLRLSYDFSPKIIIETALSSQGFRTAPVRFYLRHVYGRRSYDFLKCVKVQTTTKS